MNYLTTIVCLANSRKKSGRCIAGKLLDEDPDARWIRPVSARPSREVSEWERQYQDGSDPRLLDILAVPMISAEQDAHQPENHLIADEYYWEKKGTFHFSELSSLFDGPRTLWQNGFSSTGGCNNRIPDHFSVEASLYLVPVENLNLVVGRKSSFPDAKRAVRGAFEYNGVYYTMDVTHPIVERTFLAKPDDTYVIGDVALCVSLSESFNGHCYKLIATIFSKDFLP